MIFRDNIQSGCFVGVREGSRLHLLGVRSWGFNSPHVHTLTIGPTGGANHRQDTSSGRSRKDGVSRPAVIFALGSEESKGENDMPQLPDRRLAQGEALRLSWSMNSPRSRGLSNSFMRQ